MSFDRFMIEPDTPLRLSVAAKLAFPDGSMTESGLKTEHGKGNLECERIANKLYTTLNNIKQMRERCRESRRGQGSGSESEKAVRPYGSFSTPECLKSAQASANQIAEKLKRHSKPTSLQNIGRNGEKAHLPRSR